MHGEFGVVAAMTTVLVLNAAKYPYWFATLAGMLTGPAIGALIELTLVRPMIRQQATEDQFVLLTIGLERAIAASSCFGSAATAICCPPLAAITFSSFSTSWFASIRCG